VKGLPIPPTSMTTMTTMTTTTECCAGISATTLKESLARSKPIAFSLAGVRNETLKHPVANLAVQRF